MNQATREKLIILLLPSALVALIWFGWFRPTSRLAAQAKSAETARATTPTQTQLDGEQARLKELTAEVADLQQNQSEYLRQWNSLGGQLTPRQSRPHALERLGALFRERDLTVLQEKSGEGGGNQHQPVAVEQLQKKFAQPLETTFPELKGTPAAAAAKADSLPADARSTWTIEFAGTYANVQAAMAQLVNEDTDFLPVSLRMAEANPAIKLRRWTLVIRL